MAGSPIQEEIRTFQMLKKKSPTGVLSKKYWTLFMKRHKEVLQVKRGYRVASNRTEWVTYDNIQLMHDLLYDHMVDAGIAVQLVREDEASFTQSL